MNPHTAARQTPPTKTQAARPGAGACRRAIHRHHRRRRRAGHCWRGSRCCGRQPGPGVRVLVISRSRTVGGLYDRHGSRGALIEDNHALDVAGIGLAEDAADGTLEQLRTIASGDNRGDRGPSDCSSRHGRPVWPTVEPADCCLAPYVWHSQVREAEPLGLGTRAAGPRQGAPKQLLELTIVLAEHAPGGGGESPAGCRGAGT